MVRFLNLTLGMRIILQLLSLNGLSPELELSSHRQKEDKGCSKSSEYFEETKTSRNAPGELL